MAVTEDTSMVTNAEAAAYFAGRLHADAWDNASAGDQDKALITATRHINAMPMWGVKKETIQPHVFPRCYLVEDVPQANVRFMPKGGWVCEDAIPSDVKDAVCEQALFLLNQTAYDRHRAMAQAAGVNQTSAGSASEGVDPSQVTKGQWGPRMSPEATRLLSPYIATVVGLG